MRVEVNPGNRVDTALRKQPFYPGEQFDIDDKEGRRLVTANVVSEINAAASAAGGPQQLNVTETVKLVMAAATMDELDPFRQNETRKGVLDAIDKRAEQLRNSASDDGSGKRDPEKEE